MKKKFNLKMKNYNFSDPVKKLYFNKHLFTEVAPKYNFLTTILSFGRDKAWKKLLVKKMPSINKPSCLDVACGTGDIIFQLLKKYPDAIITGIDLNDTMLEIAKKRIKNLNVDFKIADMCNTGLKADSYDLITGGYALRNAPDLKITLFEIKRIMNPGASACFLDFSKSGNKFLQVLELFLLKLWGSIWGIILHGNPEIYAYIAESLKKFPDRHTLIKLLEQIGFKNIKTKKLFFGFLELIWFTK